MITTITVEQLFSGNYQLIDVRAPLEFAQGHITGACNIPLFSDHVRALVGCVYAQKGKQEAMRFAMHEIGPQLGDLVDQVCRVHDGRLLCIYCARGGMRSGAVAWLFSFFQLPVVRLHGGYKAFRNWALIQHAQVFDLRVLGGKTGSGKTDFLHFLVDAGEQIIDLEALAHHKGSVFGGDKDFQATQQQFENDLACQCATLNKQRRVWIEDESRKIGSVIIPEPFWLSMKQAPWYMLNTRLSERVARIIDEYGGLEKDFLLHALTEIKDHLGLQRYEHIKTLIEGNDLVVAVNDLLVYYDKKYTHNLKEKNKSGFFVGARYFTF
jgi:tRNA 2-selenouridine synthase